MLNDYKNINVDNLTISPEQLVNAKIYTNRWEWIKSLPEQLNIIEVGVASGDFSEHILNNINPKNLYLVDFYDQGDPMLARPGKERRYVEGENYDYVVNRFKNNSNVKVVKANSQEYLPILATEMPKQFDMVYLDASHKFVDVCGDLDSAVKLLGPDGIVAFNDYIFADENGEKYGVVEAANKFLYANRDWEVVGFALDERMYSDLYIRKIKV